MKTKHDGDCTIYSSQTNQRPQDGICTCGYGLEKLRSGDNSEIYSQELKINLEAKLKNQNE